MAVEGTVEVADSEAGAMVGGTTVAAMLAVMEADTMAVAGAMAAGTMAEAGAMDAEAIMDGAFPEAGMVAIMGLVGVFMAWA